VTAAVLFDEVIDRLALPTLELAGQDQQDQPKDRRGDHEAQLISQTLRKNVD
jgi:hypothetical protein